MAFAICGLLSRVTRCRAVSSSQQVHCLQAAFVVALPPAKPNRIPILMRGYKGFGWVGGGGSFSGGELARRSTISGRNCPTVGPEPQPCAGWCVQVESGVVVGDAGARAPPPARVRKTGAA